MAGKARITSDFPSGNEVAERLGIPSRRVDELRKQLHDIHIISHPNGGRTVAEIKSPRNGAKSRASRKKQQ